LALSDYSFYRTVALVGGDDVHAAGHFYVCIIFYLADLLHAASGGVEDLHAGVGCAADKANGAFNVDYC
jgi:hypothetical protein